MIIDFLYYYFDDLYVSLYSLLDHLSPPSPFPTPSPPFTSPPHPYIYHKHTLIIL